MHDRQAVLQVLPAPDSANPPGSVSQISVVFNEPMAANTVTPATFRLIAAGPDRLLDTGDDAQITNGTLAFDANAAKATWAKSMPSTCS